MTYLEIGEELSDEDLQIKQPSSIALKDGREIRIYDKYEDARKVDKLFQSINSRVVKEQK